MIFNKHLDLAGRHAFLSASKYHWINYDDEKLTRAFRTSMAAQRGTDLHAFAHEAIRLGVRMGKSPKTLNMYVNDAIGYRMACEQILVYSDNAFGTADTIAFRKNKLRIHDLKTGVMPTSENQLFIYAALFCLEYRFKPFDIEMIFRIYQNDEIREYEGDPDRVAHIMDRIITFDRRINEIRMEDMS